MKKLLLVLALLSLLVACGKDLPAEKTDLTGDLLVSDQIIVGTSPDYEPFEFIGVDGKLSGFDVELMEALLAIINADNGLSLKLSWKEMDFDLIIGALQAQQIDIGVSGFTYDAKRDVYFSKPYIISQQVVVVKQDSTITTVADLSGKKIGVQTGTTGEEAAKEVEGATLVSVSDAQQLFAQLLTNAIDAVVIDKAVGEGFVKNQDAKILTEVLADENMSIIIAKNKPDLQKAIDLAIVKFMESDDYLALLKKWDIEQ